MAAETMTVALIHEVFHGPGREQRLHERLGQARRRGADLALLPELPLDPWVPASRNPRDGDAEPPDGPRQRLLAAAARAAGIGVHGGAIVHDAASGERRNRALLLDATGRLVATYDKLHLPCEPGFWERDHYGPGDEPPHRVDGFALALGLQICSDLQRPAGTQLLGALGAEAILAPRATPPESYERWRTVIRADAITSASYVVSVNRPAPEGAAPIGGPSIAVAPGGEVLAETTEPLALLRLERAAVAAARRDYPGYLDVRAELYARAWAALCASPRPRRAR